MPLDSGDPAPHVSAPNQAGERVELDLSSPTVIFFYPEDGTPGCTTEAAQFQREIETYREAGVGVFGASTDGVDDHAAFAADEGLEFDLLADPDGGIAAAFGVERRPDGRAERTTVVCADGEIHAVYEGVRPDGHAREVLMDLLDAGIVRLA